MMDMGDQVFSLSDMSKVEVVIDCASDSERFGG